MIIWYCRDAQGRYWGQVIRTDDRHGQLQLLDSGDRVLREMRVHLAYGAIFGPDVADCNDWNRVLTAWSDELDKEERTA